MEFYTAFTEKRPVRLCESTRAFAYESLYEHKYGKEALSTPFISLDNAHDFSDLSELDRYDLAICEIAKNAPVRICPHELISGSATLGDAISHSVPVRYKNEAVFSSISHLTIDFPKVLRVGINGIRAEVEDSLKRHTETVRIRFLKSCISCLDSFELWHGRYLEALSSLDGYDKNLNNLSKVPMDPPSSFHEAVQSLWFVFAFCRLCGNWPGIGRIDLMLGDFLKKDLADGKIGINEAREILAHFFIKGCEWVAGGNYVSGDAQHYQNLVIAGVDANGNEITNEVTYLVLDIIEELGISDFPTTVRISEKTPKKLIDRVSAVMRYGNGVLAIYNEELIINSLTDFGYSLDEARAFANDGCWEVQIPGKTYFGYVPFDALQILQKNTLRCYEDSLGFSTFEELYLAFSGALKAEVEEIYNERVNRLERKNKGYYGWNEGGPCTVVSLFTEGCIESGLSYCDGGAVYNVTSPHIGGIADVANELYVIKKLCFDEKRLTLSELLDILKNNWEGHEELRKYVSSSYELYGNDNDEVDSIVSHILSDFADYCNALDGRCSVKFPPGVSTFGRQIDWASSRLACAAGRNMGEVLANNMSPAPGTTLKGATAIINSYCKSDLSRMTNGAALDIRLLISDVKGDRGIDGLSSLITGFVALGGFFLQIDVADSGILKDAKINPEKYPALAVRVAGWNARFVTLSEEWQDMIINNIEK